MIGPYENYASFAMSSVTCGAGSEVSGNVLLRPPEGSIAVHCVCSTLDNGAASHVSTGGGKGALQTDSFVIVKNIDIASPILHQMMARGELVKHAHIDCG